MLFKTKSTYDYMAVCLGNPGLEYEKTRHNAGFMAADKILAEYKPIKEMHKFSSIAYDLKINNCRILLLKPQTYMNNSGKAVHEAATFYKIKPEQIVIIFDDISLPPGKMRIRPKGSAGGHNGLKDIFQIMGSENFPRIKIGVGEKPHPDCDLKDWVLGKFSKDDFELFSSALNKIPLALLTIISNGVENAMNKFN